MQKGNLFTFTFIDRPTHNFFCLHVSFVGLKRLVLFAAVTLRPKGNKRVLLACISCPLCLILVILLTMNLWKPSLNLWTPSVPSCNCTERPCPSAPTTRTPVTTLFDDERKDAVLNCITGEVIGMRPRHIDTVDVRHLRPSDDFEPDQHRKAAFNEIFDKKAWGRNPSVSFSGSGRAWAMLFTSFCHVINYNVTSFFTTESSAVSNICQFFNLLSL